MANIAQPSGLPEVLPVSDKPVSANSTFWSERTHEAEARAREHLTDPDIDRIFDEVAAVIDEDLLRFDPLVGYYGRYFPEGDDERIEVEREAAHCLKRDLAWAAVEQATGQPGFFAFLLRWYDQGRWPCDWAGTYPVGHVLVL